MVKVYNDDSPYLTVLVFFIDNKEFHRGNTKSGDWVYQVKLPADLKSGDHDMLRGRLQGQQAQASPLPRVQGQEARRRRRQG